jgi:hypothetical protein
MKHLKLFEEFISEKELTDSELESQTVPTHVVTKNYKIPGAGGIGFYKYDLQFVDFEGSRLIVIDGANPYEIIDFDEDDWKGWESFIIPIDSPEGKEFMHSARGKYKISKFGL